MLKTLFLTVALMLFGAAAQAGVHAVVHNTSGATTGEDSLTVLFVVTDSIHNVSGFDSLFIAICNSLGDSVFAAAYITTASQIDSIDLGGNRIVWRWTEAVANIDASGRKGGYVGILIAVDTLDGTSADYLDEHGFFSFQLTNREYALQLDSSNQTDFANDISGLNIAGGIVEANVEEIENDNQSSIDLKDFADEGYNPTTNLTRSDLAAMNTSATSATDLKDFADAGYDPVFNVSFSNLKFIDDVSAAATNLLADYDGTGYAKGGASLVNTVTNLTNQNWSTAQRDSILAALQDANLRDKIVPYDSLDYDDTFWEKIAGVTDSGATGSSPWSAGQRDSVLAALSDVNLKDKIVPLDSTDFTDSAFTGGIFATNYYEEFEQLPLDSLDFDDTFWEKIAGVTDSGATGSSPWSAGQRDSILNALQDASLKDKIVPFDSLDFDDTYWEKIAGVTDSGATGSSPWSSGQRDSVLNALQDVNLKDKIVPYDSLDYDDTFWEKLAGVSDSGATGGSSPWSSGQRDSVLLALQDANLDDKVTKIFNATQRDSLLDAVQDASLDDKVTKIFNVTQRDSLLDALQDASLKDKIVPFDSLDYDDTYWEKLAGVSDSGAVGGGSPWSTGQRDSVLAAIQDANLKDKIVPFDSLDYDDTYWEKLAGVSDSGATGSSPWSAGQRDSVLQALEDDNLNDKVVKIFNTTQRDSLLDALQDASLKDKVTPYDSLDYDDTYWEKLAGVSDSGATGGSSPWSAGQRDSVLQALEDDNLDDKVTQRWSVAERDSILDALQDASLKDKVTPYDSLDYDDTYWEKLAGVSDSGATGGSSPWSTGQRDSVLAAIQDANLKDKIVPFDSLDYDDTYWEKIAGVSDSGAVGGGSPWSAAQRDSILAALQDANLKDKVVPYDSLDFDDTYWEKLAGVSDSGISGSGSSPFTAAHRDSILNVMTDPVFRFKLLGDSLTTPGELERLVIDGGSLAGHDGFLQTFTFEDSANANAPINQLPVFVNNFAQTMLKPYNGLTDNNGDISFNLAPGNWVVFHTSEIWNFRLDSFVVTGAATQTFEHYTDLSANHAAVLGFIGGASGGFPNGTVEVQLRAYSSATELIINDTLYGQIRVSYPTDANGKFEIPLIQTDQFTSPDTAYYRFAFKDQNGRRVRVGGDRYITVSLVAADVTAGVASFNSLTRVSPE